LSIAAHDATPTDQHRRAPCELGISVSKWVSVFYGAAYQKLQSAMFMLPEKAVPSAVVGQSVGDVYAAGLEESSTGEVRRQQKFCRHN